jgi:cytoskeleton protein RodZ
MLTVGEQLKAAREKKNISLHQVAETTKIKTDQLRALEAGQFEIFIAPIYIRGFVRSYARYLKLDEATLLAQLDQELGQPEPADRQQSTPAEQPALLDVLMLRMSRLNWRLWAALLLMAVGVTISVSAVRTWQTNRKTDPLKDLGPGIYEPAQPSAGEVLPVPK